MLKKISLISCLFMTLFVAYCYADVPNEIRYNGKLKEYRMEVNGTKQMNFKFYSEPTGGTALWESGTQSVKVSSGIFTYVIKPGSVDWRNKDIYLEIVIDNNVLEPREKLLAVPYSLHSNTTEAATVTEEADFSVTVGNKKQFFVDKNNAKFIDEKGIEFYMVPKGAIIIWSGSADKIPTGWALCDGTNGTPDLRGKFVLGAVSETGNKYSVGKSGGEEEHTLTIEEMPNHSHDYYTGRGESTVMSGYIANAEINKVYQTLHTNSVGNSKSHNNMPPYYSLCYIMRVD